MVLKGQFLERPTLVPVREELVLEGLWHRGQKAPALLVLPPPTHEGSGMDHVLCAELAWACARAGHPELRFNFRGVGASQGDRGTGLSQLEDAQAALRLVEENAPGPVAVAAIWGSALVARALLEIEPQLAGLALIDPPPEELPELARVKAPLLVVIPEASPLPRAELSAAVAQAGGRLVIVEGADRTFRKNLPEVGRALAQWLDQSAP